MGNCLPNTTTTTSSSQAPAIPVDRPLASTSKPDSTKKTTPSKTTPPSTHSNSTGARPSPGPSVSEQRAALQRGYSGPSASVSSSSSLSRSNSFVKAVLQQTEAKSVKDFEQLRAVLKDHPWLSSHTEVQLDDVARFMKVVELSLDAKPVVYEKGDLVDDRFFIVKSGTFTLTQDEGDQLSTQKLSEWSSFGESALRFKGARGETVTLTSPKGELFFINASEYQAIIVKEQKIADRGAFDFLRSVKLLQQLTDEQVHVLGKCLHRRTFHSGDKIIEQGSKGAEFFFLEQGLASAYQHTQKGDKDTVSKVNSFKTGDYFGEGAMLQDEPRSADVVAEGTGPVVTLVLRKIDFVELLGGLGQIVHINFIARVLKAVDMFKGLTDAEMLEIANHMEVERFSDGEVIMKQGEQGDKLYILKDGEVAFSRRKEETRASDSPENAPAPHHHTKMTIVALKADASLLETGAEMEIGRLFTGQVFGEGALLTDAPRRATAKAQGEVTVLSLGRAVFGQVFKQSLQDLLNRDFAMRRDLDDDEHRRELMEFKDLVFIDLLGVGTYGQVMLVSHKVTGQTYALKTMAKQRIKEMDQKEHVENERKILSMVNHPFVVNLVQTFAGPDNVMALMEAVLGGELFAYLRTVGRLKPKDARFYMGQIVLAFEYLHSLNIVYRDLKPENLLVMPSGFIKMADFGLAKIVKPGESTFTLCGTPAYAAPEVYGMKGHGKPVDWWGLGVLCHELISGATPFDGDAASIFDAMQRYSRAYPNIKLPRRLDGSVAGDLVLKLLHPNPLKRLGGGAGGAQGAIAIKAHPFFDDLNWQDLVKFKGADVPPYKPQIHGGYDTRNFYEPAIGNDKVMDLAKVDPSTVVAGGNWEI